MQHEGQYRLLFEQNPQPMWVFDVETLAFVAVNDAAVSHYGYSREEFLAMTIKDIRPPEAVPAFLDFLRELLKNNGTGPNSAGVWKHRKKDGDLIDVEITRSHITFQGRDSCLVLAADITERIETERKLRSSKSTLSKAQQIAHVGSWDWDLRTNRTAWSDEMCRIHGIDPARFDGQYEVVLAKSVHTDDRTKLREATERALATGVPQPLEYRIIWPDGSEHLVYADGEFIHDENGKPVRMVGTVQDITEQRRSELALREAHAMLERRVEQRTAELQMSNEELRRAIVEQRRAEEALQESEVKFRTLAETVAAATFIFQGDQLLYVNSAAEAVTGFAREELLKMEFWDVIDTEFRGVVRERGIRRQRGEAVVPNCEVKIRTKGGEERWVDFTAGTIEFQGKAAVLGTAFDITERRQAEAGLRSSEERFRQLAEGIREVFWMTNVEKTQMIYVSPGYEEIWGRSCEGLYAAPMTWMDAILPEDREQVRRAATSDQASGQYNVEYRIERPGGEIRWIRDRAFPIRDGSGTVYRIAGFAEDITELKRAEEALKTHSRVLESMVEGVVVTDPQTAQITFTNPAFDAMFGYEPGELIGKHVSVLNDYPPDENARLVSEIIRKLNAEGRWIGEVKNRRKDGTSFVTFARVSVLDISGKKHWICVQQDITENKVQEQLLRESEAKNKAILNALPDLMFRLTREGTYLDFKASHPGELYVPPDAIIGRNVREIMPGGFVDICLSNIRKTLDTGAMQVFEYQLVVKEMLQDYEARLVVSGENEVLAIVRNITERKRLEKQILDISDREQRRIGQDLHDGLCQHLTGTAFASKVLEQKLAEKSLAESADAREIAELIDQAISQARTLARGLYPAEMEADGLGSALQQLASNVENLFDIRCNFMWDASVQIQEMGTSTHLYRIAQEAVNNAIRHGKAKHIEIALSGGDGGITLTVTDDGQGIPKVVKNSNGLGLHIMKYRARMIGASLEVRSGARKGTTICCTLSHAETEKRREVGRGEKATT